MSSPIRVFIGSSSEARQRAESIQTLLFRAGGSDVRVRAWWDDDVFLPGRTFIESLVKVMEETDVAILLATPDDKTAKRGEHGFAARDNVVFECGMSVGKHTRERTALVVLGDAKLPSDLAGVNHLVLAGDPRTPEFVERNRDRMRLHLQLWRDDIAGANREARTVLPKLHEAIARVIGRFQASPRAPRLDEMAAAVVESVAEQFSDDKARHGITDFVCRTSAEDLKNATATWALDVLGPSAWLTPTAFRYLAVQIREYFRANSTGGSLPVKVSPAVAIAIRRAHKNVVTISGKQGATKFDDQLVTPPEPLGGEAILQWVEAAPELEFVRILLWTREEFENPVAQSVIHIHEAFHVPLFGLVMPHPTSLCLDSWSA